jgi:hypothetical protein
MSGRKGRSGAKPPDVLRHVISGTFRSDRHGSALARLEESAPPPAVSPEARRRVLRGLGPAGATVVKELLDAYGPWSPGELFLLRRLGEAVSTITDLRDAIAADGAVLTGARGARKPHPLLATVRAETRTLHALYRELNLRED